MITTIVGSASVLVLLGLWLSVRLLIIQNLNILIIIIIISFLTLHLEPADRYARHSTILSLVTASYRAWRSINIVVGIGALTRRQVTSGTQRRRLVMHQALLLCNVDRVHLHVWIVVHGTQILHVHVVNVIGGSNEELLLLLLSAIRFSLITSTIVLLLLLQLHLTVFVFAVRKCMIQTLCVIPCLLGTLLSIGTLRTWSLWQLEVIVTALLVWICWNRLHVKSTAIHGCVLRARSLFILGHLNIKRASFVFIKQIIELVVRCAIECCLMVRSATVAANLTLIAKDAFVVPEIGRRLLKTVVVRERSLYLVHV